MVGNITASVVFGSDFEQPEKSVSKRIRTRKKDKYLIFIKAPP